VRKPRVQIDREAVVGHVDEGLRVLPAGAREPVVEVVSQLVVATDRDFTFEPGVKLGADGIEGADDDRSIGRIFQLGLVDDLAHDVDRRRPADEIAGDVERRVGRRREEADRCRNENPGVG